MLKSYTASTPLDITSFVNREKIKKDNLLAFTPKSHPGGFEGEDGYVVFYWEDDPTSKNRDNHNTNLNQMIA